MPAHSPKRIHLPPLTQEIVSRAVSSDTSEKRALRANIVYQASIHQPELMHLYSPRIAGLLLRHVMFAVEGYQSNLAVRGLVKSAYSEGKTVELKSIWDKTPYLAEHDLKARFTFWFDLPDSTQRQLLAQWWRYETGRTGSHVWGFSDKFFENDLRSTREKKMVKEITERVEESTSLLVEEGEFVPGYLDYLVCLAWRGYQISEEIQSLFWKVSGKLSSNDNQVGSNTSSTHKAY